MFNIVYKTNVRRLWKMKGRKTSLGQEPKETMFKALMKKPITNQQIENLIQTEIT